MKRLAPALLILACACATPGPYLRVATATRHDLEEAQKKPVIWYEFQPGDVVPFQFAFFGVLEGGAELAPLRAKKRFYLIARQDAPMGISFDGSSYAGPQASQSIIAVVPRKDGDGAQVGWLHYLGESADPEAELKHLLGDQGDQKAP